MKLVTITTLKVQHSPFLNSAKFSIQKSLLYEMLASLIFQSSQKYAKYRRIMIGLVQLLCTTFVMLFAICYHLYNSKNVKNTHGRETFLVKLQASTIFCYKWFIMKIFMMCFPCKPHVVLNSCFWYIIQNFFSQYLTIQFCKGVDK